MSDAENSSLFATSDRTSLPNGVGRVPFAFTRDAARFNEVGLIIFTRRSTLLRRDLHFSEEWLQPRYSCVKQWPHTLQGPVVQTNPSLFNSVPLYLNIYSSRSSVPPPPIFYFSPMRKTLSFKNQFKTFNQFKMNILFLEIFFGGFGCHLHRRWKPLYLATC